MKSNREARRILLAGKACEFKISNRKTFYQSKTGRLDCASDHKRSARQARARKLAQRNSLAMKEQPHD